MRYDIHFLLGAAFLAGFLAAFLVGLLAAAFCGVAEAEPAWACGAAWAGAALLATLLVPFLAVFLAILLVPAAFFETLLAAVFFGAALAIKGMS